jgi:hypothetical protein
MTRRNRADDPVVARTRTNRGDLAAGPPPGSLPEGLERTSFDAVLAEQRAIDVLWREATDRRPAGATTGLVDRLTPTPHRDRAVQ